MPLLLFTAAARRLPYSTLGFLQYVAPSLQFLLAVLVFGEPLTRAHAICFGAIWTALAIFSFEGWRGPGRAAPSLSPAGNEHHGSDDPAGEPAMKTDPRIDAYIARQADFARPILDHLRDIVHEACPEGRGDAEVELAELHVQGQDPGRLRRVQGARDLRLLERQPGARSECRSRRARWASSAG